MLREPGHVLSPPIDQVELALERVEQSAEFRSSPRHRALLRHLVAQAMGDNHDALKETVIAVEFYGRPAASFDPRVDTIVRVEARRLRWIGIGAAAVGVAVVWAARTLSGY